MPNRLKLISPIPESVNHFFRYRAYIKNGKAIASGYKTNAASEYQHSFAEYVKEEAARQGWEKCDNKFQHYYIDADFYFPRTDKDPNNYWKLLLDAITQSGVVWSDDNVTCERVNKIVYDSQNPRIELEIYPVDYIGVFCNTAQLNEFESRCVDCRRYKNNCSILRKAKEGRVQSEIQGDTCTKRSPYIEKSTCHRKKKSRAKNKN